MSDVGTPLPPGVVETHTSTLFFLGDRVFKVKKPLDLGFLDHRSLAARRRSCSAEVELNRRLAPDVYLGVAELRGPDGLPCESLVVMRRMPEDARLSALVRRGLPVEAALVDIARRVASFHAGCPRSPALDALAGRDAVQDLWEQGLSQLAPFRGTLVADEQLDEMARLARRYLSGRSALFGRRQAEGQVVDGHGDLLADDVFVLPDGARVLDCLEFDGRLRAGDVLADVAFLAMDLERLGRADLARLFLADYRRFSGESHPASLEHHYIAYRAFVRCKVSCIRASQSSGAEAATAAAEAGGLAGIASRHLRAAQVRLVLVGGLPGTGKSTLAAALADRTRDLALLRSDEVRKELAGLPSTRPAAAPVDEGLYTAAHRRQTYQELLDRARRCLEAGQSVVLDASWTDGEMRAAAAGIAERAGADLVALQCVAPQAVALDRIARRGGGTSEPDASDADAAVHAALAARADSWPDAVRIATDVPLTDAVEQAVRALDPNGDAI